MYRLEFRYRFEAAHRFIGGSFTNGSSDFCATPHGHSWWATLQFTSETTRLGSDAMLEEFHDLKAPWRRFLSETVDHSFFYHYQDPILPALREHIPGFRGIPFPCDPTTEAVAALFFEKASALYEDLLRPLPLNLNAVRIDETPTNSLAYEPTNREAFFAPYARFEGWWQSKDLADRSLRAI